MADISGENLKCHWGRYRYIRKKPKEFCIQRMAGADGQMENQIICDRVFYRKVDSGINVVVYDLMTEEIEDQFGIDVSDGCRIVR